MRPLLCLDELTFKGRIRTCDTACQRLLYPLSYLSFASDGVRSSAYAPAAPGAPAGLENPDRCETSFHRSRIDAAFAAPIRLAASRRMRGLPLRTPKTKRPRGQASRGRSLKPREIGVPTSLADRGQVMRARMKTFAIATTRGQHGAKPRDSSRRWPCSVLKSLCFIEVVVESFRVAMTRGARTLLPNVARCKRIFARAQCARQLACSVGAFRCRLHLQCARV